MILLLILAPLAVRAAETAIVDVCLRCHGSEGLAANPAAPDLANQRRPYLEKQIADFRRNAREPLIAHSNAGNFTGQRDHPDMYAFANLFETETGSLIAALSARACRQASPPPGHTVSRPLPRPALVERCFACHGTQGARIVNISRGEVIDEPALIAALEKKHLGGAYLDVFAQEPLPAASPLWEMPNVLVTAHDASTSDAYDPRINALFLDNLARWQRKEPLLNEVTQL